MDNDINVWSKSNSGSASPAESTHTGGIHEEARKEEKDDINVWKESNSGSASTAESSATPEENTGGIHEEVRDEEKVEWAVQETNNQRMWLYWRQILMMGFLGFICGAWLLQPPMKNPSVKNLPEGTSDHDTIQATLAIGKLSQAHHHAITFQSELRKVDPDAADRWKEATLALDVVVDEYSLLLNTTTDFSRQFRFLMMGVDNSSSQQQEIAVNFNVAVNIMINHILTTRLQMNYTSTTALAIMEDMSSIYTNVSTQYDQSNESWLPSFDGKSKKIIKKMHHILEDLKLNLPPIQEYNVLMGVVVRELHMRDQPKVMDKTRLFVAAKRVMEKVGSLRMERNA
ncbi:hypothetical protein BC567DRAFT_253423 [Phyllosticta citribraziliensis]